MTFPSRLSDQEREALICPAVREHAHQWSTWLPAESIFERRPNGIIFVHRRWGWQVRYCACGMRETRRK